MQKSLLLILLAALLILTTSCRTAGGTGALVGGGLGAGTGALIDSGNPWRGALIGGLVGSVLGYAVGNEVDNERERCCRAAYYERRVVTREVYDTETRDRYQIQAVPAGDTRVTTTVSRYDPATGRWVVQSESTQSVN